MKSTLPLPAKDGWFGAARRATLAILLLFLLLVLPTSLEGFRMANLLVLPLALPILVLLATLFPGVGRQISVIAASAMLFSIVLLKIADALALFAFARPFNAYLHLPLVEDGVRFLASSLGIVGATVVVVAASLVIAAGGFGIFCLMRSLNTSRVPQFRRFPLVVGGAILATWGVLFVGGARNAAGPIAQDTVFASLWSRALEHQKMALDLPFFQASLAADPYLAVEPKRRLSALDGTDVLVLFIESYGRATLESPLYASRMDPLLDAMGKRMASSGLTTASGWMTSTTYGGQSWLAHSSLLSGLPIDRPSRYDALLLSKRMTLARDFHMAGQRSVFVMPAIVRPWPEAAFYGFDHIYTAENLSYRGKAIHYMTMPDQFTLSALYDRELSKSKRPNLFSTIALISSHAPWTPIPAIKPWSGIGDGNSFDSGAFSGLPPEKVWSETESIREYYVESITYVLKTIESFLIERLDGNALVFILGDHQPLPFVTRNAPTRDVPIHVVSRDGKLVRALAPDWLSPGMKPAPGANALPMENFRGRLIETFTPGLSTARPNNQRNGAQGGLGQ